MAIRDPSDSKIQKLFPVVLYAVERKINKGKADYWDYAALLDMIALRLLFMCFRGTSVYILTCFF
jgi:hypothetical protein